jgi:hypothetical protein
MIGDDFVDLIFNFEVALFFTLKLSYDYAYSAGCYHAFSKSFHFEFSRGTSVLKITK